MEAGGWAEVDLLSTLCPQQDTSMPAQAGCLGTPLLIPYLAIVWAMAPKSSDTVWQQASLALGLVSLTRTAAIVYY